MRKVVAILAGLTPFFIAPQPVSAHSFGKLYNLPVPFWMYLYGGAAAILVSFLIIGYFFNRTSKDISYPKVDLSQWKIFTLFTNHKFVLVLQGISLFLFGLTIATGFSPNDYSYAKFNMTFFWILFTLGFAYLTAIIGNAWTVLNPWKLLVGWFEAEKGIISYPKKLGYYPALLFYFLFIWIELMGNTTPLTLSFILVQYTFINLFGVFLIGKSMIPAGHIQADAADDMIAGNQGNQQSSWCIKPLKGV